MNGQVDTYRERHGVHDTFCRSIRFDRILCNGNEIETAFTEPGTILVHNMEGLYADERYDGYRRIREIMEQGNEMIVVLDKEEAHE